MNFDVLFTLWVLCAGLCYFIARDRAPSKAPLATLFGFLFGPIGVGITFFLSEEPATNNDSSDVPSPTKYGTFDSTVDNEMTDVLPADYSKSMEELKRDLEGLKTKLKAADKN